MPYIFNTLHGKSSEYIDLSEVDYFGMGSFDPSTNDVFKSAEALQIDAF